MKKLSKVSPMLRAMLKDMKAMQEDSSDDVSCMCFEGMIPLFYVKMLERLGLISGQWLPMGDGEVVADNPCEGHIHFVVNKGALKGLKYEDVVDMCWGRKKQ